MDDYRYGYIDVTELWRGPRRARIKRLNVTRVLVQVAFVVIKSQINLFSRIQNYALSTVKNGVKYCWNSPYVCIDIYFGLPKKYFLAACLHV